jgi:catechol 2,3-dioxygenase-like lactoylglutathione lyase family enzyme
MLFTSLQLHAVEIDFTRHVARYVSAPVAEGESAAFQQDTFFGVPGSAKLIVSSSGEITGLTIQLNGETLVSPDNYNAAAVVELPVTLLKDNTVAVSVVGATDSSVSVRVKQLADVKLNVTSRLHFNTNVRDYEAASQFYEKLGFGTFTGFPGTNTQAMAQAIGIKTPTSYDGSQGGEAGGYLLKGQLKSLSLSTWGGDALKGGLIDLIEFKIPRREEPPYAGLNHLGIARASMYTMDIAADYEYMKGLGVKFISAPVTRSDGIIFAIFSDLDGTHYQLIQKEHEAAEAKTTHIFSLAQVNINASDFERSRAWYQMFGYELTDKLPATDSVEVANAMGFDQPYEIDGGILTNVVDGSMVELVQWISPYNPERAYDAPANHLGIARIAFATDDIDADVAALKAQGVEFLSPITPCCMGPDSSGSIVAFLDPDGAIIELAETDFWSTVGMMWWWIKDEFFK